MSEKEKRTWEYSFLPRALIAWMICASALLLSGSVLYAADGAALSTLGYASSLISFLAAVGAGAAAVSAQKEAQLLKGLVSGLCLTAMLLLTGFLVRGRLQGSAVLSTVSFTLSGCLLGAMLPVRRRKGQRFRTKRKRG